MARNGRGCRQARFLSSFARYRAVYGGVVADRGGGLTITIVQAFYLDTPDALVCSALRRAALALCKFDGDRQCQGYSRAMAKSGASHIDRSTMGFAYALGDRQA